MSKKEFCENCKYCKVAENIDMSGYCPIGDTSRCCVEPKSILRSQFSAACRLFEKKEN